MEYERAGAAQTAAGATAPLVVATRADDRRDGARRGHSPGGWPGATHEALRGQTKASSRGRRLGVLKEPEPPNVVERVLRHTVQQFVDAVPLVPLLDDPVPQTVGTVLDFFRALDLPVTEQVIAVPKSLAASGGAASPSDGRTVGGSADSRVLFFVIAARGGV